jgi:hypothetical protein
MKQPDPIVASMVVADKYVGSGGTDNLTACVACIMGMSNITTRPKICQQLMSEFFAMLNIIHNQRWVWFHVQTEGEDVAGYTLSFYLRT